MERGKEEMREQRSYVRNLRSCENKLALIKWLSFEWSHFRISSTESITRTTLYLTDRFHFAVHQYSDNVQMTSKRGENKVA